MTTLRLYHLTSAPSANRILRGGFRDDYSTFGDMPGIWVCSFPYDPMSLPEHRRAALLAADVDEDELADFEVAHDPPLPPPEPGTPSYREWVLPAAALNRWRWFVVDRDAETQRLWAEAEGRVAE